MDELAVHELAETEFRKLAPEARSLDAAEGQMRRRPGGLIDEDHAAFDPFGERLAMRDIVGKDGGAEPVWRIVRKSDRRLFVLDDEEGGDRTEQFLAVDGIVVRDIGQNGRLEIEAGAIVTFSAKHDLGSSLARGGDLFQETFECALGRKRPEARRHLIGIAGLERARLASEELQKSQAPPIANDDALLRRNAA